MYSNGCKSKARMSMDGNGKIKVWISRYAAQNLNVTWWIEIVQYRIMIDYRRQKGSDRIVGVCGKSVLVEK